MKIEGEVYMREFDCGGSYSQYGDIEFERGWHLTDELLHEFEGKKVKVTIEVIEDK